MTLFIIVLHFSFFSKSPDFAVRTGGGIGAGLRGNRPSRAAPARARRIMHNIIQHSKKQGNLPRTNLNYYYYANVYTAETARQKKRSLGV